MNKWRMHYRNKKLIVSLCFLLIMISVSSFILRERNNLALFLTIVLVCGMFALSVSRFRYYVDRIMIVLFPLSLTITKTVWIAHPISDTIGIRSVSAGLYLWLSDVFIIYFFFRKIAFVIHRSWKKDLLWIYIAINILSILYAYNREYSIAAVLLYLKCFVIFKWFYSYPDMNILQKGLCLGCEIALTFQAVLAFLQIAKGGPIGLDFLGENNDAMRYRIVDGAISRGAAGTFGYSAALAIFAMFTILLVYFSEKRKAKKIFFSIIALYVLYVAGSRTVILTLLIAFIYGVWKGTGRKVGKKKLMLFLSATLVVIAVIGIGVSRNAFAFITNSDIIYQIGRRISHWLLAINALSDRWLIGYGANNFTAKMTSINAEEFLYLNPVHNNYILHWFEIGILGALIYITIFLSSFIYFKYYKSASSFKKAALLFIVCVAVYNFTGWSFAAPSTIYLLWLALGIVFRPLEKGIIGE